MVEKNKGHPYAKIRRCKNMRYLYESTCKYQIDEDGTKIGRVNTKIGGPVTDFFGIYLF